MRVTNRGKFPASNVCGSIVFLAVLTSAAWLSRPADAAPRQAPIVGEVKYISIDNAVDPWSGGRLVAGGQNIVIPRNFIFDLPANRLNLQQLHSDAPGPCLATGETGLAKGDLCNKSGTGATATVLANVSDAGDVIAGQVRLEKGVESVVGNVTFLDHTEGYLRVNGIPGDPETGVMVRINDPTGRFTVQQGKGCLPGSPNCSADVRYGVDSDNYTVHFTTGYPACIPSTVTGGKRSTGGDASGNGDPFCPATNRTINNGTPVDNSYRFAPIRVGDSILATGNFERIDGVEFLSAHTVRVNVKLTTAPGQPDYMIFDEVEWDVAGFQNRRIDMVLTGSTTLPDSQLDVFAIHFDRETGQPHEYPIASTVNNPSTINQGLLPNQFHLFGIEYVVDFLVGTDPELSPCVNLANAGFAPAPAGFGCPGGGNLFIDQNFAVINPPSRDIIGRTRNKANFAIGDSVDVGGNASFNGRYLNPVSLAHPNMAGVNVAALSTPLIFTGIPWNLDRRLGPGGCGAGPCEPTDPASPFRFALDPFPFSGLDPRTQAGTPPGVLPSFPGVPGNLANKILSYYPFGPNDVFPWDNTTLVPPVQGISPTPVVNQVPVPADSPVAGVALTSSLPSPQAGGASITLTAAAIGTGGSYEYEFLGRLAGDGPFSVARSYGADPAWTWETAGILGGTYEIRVNARNAGSPAPFEASQTMNFTITTPAAVGVTLTSSLPSPQPAGVTVTFTAAAGGGGTYEYQFAGRSEGASELSAAQAFSSLTSWSWNTAGVPPGVYEIVVFARAAGTTVPFQASRSIRFEVQ